MSIPSRGTTLTYVCVKNNTPAGSSVHFASLLGVRASGSGAVSQSLRSDLGPTLCPQLGLGSSAGPGSGLDAAVGDGAATLVAGMHAGAVVGEAAAIDQLGDADVVRHDVVSLRRLVDTDIVSN